MHLNEHAARNVTLDTCHAMQLHHLEPRRSEVSRRDSDILALEPALIPFADRLG